ncbi:hypothetical protein FA95DRAFT_1469156, partial [Auriscalpium vulgare]
MGNRRISDDLKDAALRMLERGHRKSEVLAVVGFSKSTLARAGTRKQLTGSVSCAPAIGRGRPRALTHHDCVFLVRLARYKPTLFLDEYQRQLHIHRHNPVSLSIIH